MKRFTALPLIGLLAMGCETITEPAPGPAPSPSFEIQDGQHNGGNPHFFFLPPVVRAPTYAGVFDGSMAPVVTVCEWDGATCTATVAEFTTTTGTGSELVRLVPEDEHYIVNWHSGDFDLSANSTYRIVVSDFDTELGHADVDVVTSGKDLKSVNTDEFIALKDGRTLPIKFRIEQGALPLIGPAGGTAVLADGAVIVDVVPGALTALILITAEPAQGLPSDPAYVVGTAYDFSPDGTAFDPAAQITIAYDPANVPAGSTEADLRLHALAAGIWEEVPGSSVDEIAKTVSGAVSSFSVYSVVAVNRAMVWSTQASGTTTRLLEVWASSTNDVYAAGDAAELLRSDGSTWTSQVVPSMPPNFDFRGLSGITGVSHDVVAGGSTPGGPAVVWHFDGAIWNQLGNFPGGPHSGAVRGISEGYFGLMVGNEQNLEGRIWGPTQINTIVTEWWGGQNTALFGVWGTSENGDGFAVGLLGLILHNDGSGWVQQAVGGPELQSVWGASVTDVFAVGAGGAIVHYDGNSWTAQTSGTTETLLEVFGSSSSDVYAVGIGNTVLHYDGTSWSSVDVGIVEDFYGVWVSANGNTVYVVGDNGVIVKGQR